MAETGESHAVKVDVSAKSATISFLTESSTIKTYSWVNGRVVPVDSDVENVKQASFNPKDFNLSDVGAMFEAAESLGASDSSPQLQIVEHDSGQVLMTVTTRPESATVFFRPDASPIRHVDFETPEGLAEGVRDAVGDRPLVLEVGYVPETGVWADAVGPEEGTLVRRRRQEKLPPYSASRKEASTLKPFDPSALDAAVIGQTKAHLRLRHRLSLDIPIRVVADNRYQWSTPTITYSFDGHTVVTDLAGIEITDRVSVK